MGWFDGWFGSSPSEDPFRKLDPKLRELLEKESPVRYTPQSDDAPPAHHGAPAAAPPVAAADPNEPAVPRQSLFPDGRYAHLWKTYRDQGAVEAETKTASEKVEDMLEAYKERNYNIGRAALENCALEQEEWVNCLKTGDWADRLQMCRHQVRRFERCYVMQSRFLKALGHGSTLDQPTSLQEDIQMHADKLYHRMLAQEQAIQEAKAAGQPAPVFAPVTPLARLPQTAAGASARTSATVAAGGEEAQSPSAETLQAWKKKIDALPEDERAAEEQALRADWLARQKVAADLQGFWDREAAERRARLAQGTASWADTIRGVFGAGAAGSSPDAGGKEGKS